MKIASININGLISNKIKINYLNEWITKNDIDIVCIQEWCIQHNNYNTQFPDKSFQFFNCFAVSNEVAILVSKNINNYTCHTSIESNIPGIWTLWVSIYSDQQALHIASLYHSPNSIYDGPIDILSKQCKHIKYIHPKKYNKHYYIINGDFNAKHNEWTHKRPFAVMVTLDLGGRGSGISIRRYA